MVCTFFLICASWNLFTVVDIRNYNSFPVSFQVITAVAVITNCKKLTQIYRRYLKLRRNNVNNNSNRKSPHVGYGFDRCYYNCKSNDIYLFFVGNFPCN